MKIIFIDNVHECVAKAFQQLGWTTDFHYKTPQIEIEKIIHLYDGIIIRSRFKLDKAFLEKATQLKFIGRPGAGLENIDLDFTKKNNIEVFRSPEGNRDAVAEHTLGMILMMLNNLKRADEEVRNSFWKREENRGHELMGKTFGIIGYGYMGKAVAKRLSGFGVKVIAFDKYLKNYSDEFAQEATLSELQQQSDFISLHLPQSEETLNYVDSAFIKKCAKPFYLINTARGKSVVTQDVLESIEKGKIMGACLDVLEFESSSFEESAFQNPIFQKLVASPKVLLSPHIAGWTYEAQFKMGDYLCKKIIGYFVK